MANNLKGFKELNCWVKARELRTKISRVSKEFPIEEKYLLKKQILSSSRSVTNNIAEGYGRYSFLDMRHFFIQARGSLAETIDHLIVAFDEQYISEELFNELESDCEIVLKLLNGFIIYIDKRRIQQLSSLNSPSPKSKVQSPQL